VVFKNEVIQNKLDDMGISSDSIIFFNQNNFYKMKTINEVKNEYSSDVMFDEFLKGVEFAQRWISVEEELPEHNKYFLKNNFNSEKVLIKRVWYDNGEVSIEVNNRFRPSENIGFVWNLDYIGSIITHWRPI